MRDLEKRGEKGGELTSTQIITIVLAIGGLIVILMFIFLLGDPSEQGQDEVCRLSVLTRATSPIESLNANIPLKCTTKKICISMSGKSDACDEFIGEKASPVSLRGLSDEEAGLKISETYARAMYDCWNMLGQGKLNVFSGGGSGNLVENLVFGDVFNVERSKKSTCVICSRVVLADDITKNITDKIDVNDYMLRNSPVPNSDVSYIGYFSGSKDVRGYTEDSLFKDKKGNDLPARNYPAQTAFVFMQILTDDDWKKAGTEAAARTTFIIGGAALINPIGVVTNVVGLVPKVVVSALAIGASAGISALNANANQQLAAGYCGDFTGEGKYSKGCSIVQATSYDVNSINGFCGTLEGSP